MANKKFDELALDGTTTQLGLQTLKLTLLLVGLLRLYKSLLIGLPQLQTRRNFLLFFFSFSTSIKISNKSIEWKDTHLLYGRLLKSVMNSRRNSFGLQPIMSGITFVCKTSKML